MAEEDDKGTGDDAESPERIAQRKADRDGWVPLDRAERMADNAGRREREAAEKRITDMEQRAAESKGRPTEHTRIELQGFVDAGRITQEDANSLWDRQLEDRVLRNVDQHVDTRLDTHSRAVAVQSQVDRYKALIPEVNTADSETRGKVAREFDDLVAMGYSNTGEEGLRTELLALRTVFGPVEALQKSRAELQTHQESDARGDLDEGEGDSTKDGWPKGLSPRQKAHYEDQIRKGILKSKEDVVKLHERVAKRRARA